MDEQINVEWWKDSASLEAVQQLVHVSSVLMRPSKLSLQPANVSVTLEPSLFPRSPYELVLGLQTVFNELMDTASRDHEFLVETFGKISLVDNFIKNLFHIYTEVMKRGYKERATLGLHRMDYMLDYKEGQLGIKQVEMNTMASSMGPLAENLQNVHNYVTSRYSGSHSSSDFQFPTCPATAGLCKGLAVAWNQYDSKDSQILFVCKDEKNIYDQRLMEYHLWKEYQIKVLQKSLLQISEEGKLDDQRRLFIGSIEIAIVYYRSGYKPDDFPTQKEWDARLMCEMSCACNCPNLPYFFVGFKKVQQLLAVPKVLERYCKSPKTREQIQSVTTGLYSLDMTPAGDQSTKMAIEKPDNFVMKPQREGGGNNIYGSDIRDKLVELGSSQEREEYILMDRIRPPVIPGVIWWRGNEQAVCHPVINELGIFGAFVRSGDKIVFNEPAGQLLKTKSPTTDEGGVGYGASALDTPLLVSDEYYIRYIDKQFTN